MGDTPRLGDLIIERVHEVRHHSGGGLSDSRIRGDPHRTLSRKSGLTWPQGAGFNVGLMKVSEVLRRSGVTRKALRLYEARGILPPTRRTASGYRIYAGDVLDVLDFLQRGRRLGLSLAEINHIIGLRRSGTAPCTHVRRLLKQKETDLRALLVEVKRILKSWPQTNGVHAAICPHIEGKGGDVIWKDTHCVPRASRARKLSSTAIRSASAKTPTQRSSGKRNGTSSLT